MNIARSAYHISCCFIAGICFFAAGTPTAAAQNAIRHLGIEQGLSNNSVRCIFQDHNGFMWFGSYEGLNRYDGYGFKVFRNRLNDSNSLPHNYIYAIAEDRQCHIWAGTGQGIGIYNPVADAWRPAYFFGYGQSHPQKITANITFIKTDTVGNVFIGTNGQGLIVRHHGQDTARQIAFVDGGQAIADYQVQAMHTDAKGQLWLLINDIGLCLYNKATHKIRLIDGTLKTAGSLQTDEAGNVWIGTITGLYRYSIFKRCMTGHYTEQAGQLSADNIATLLFDKQRRLWIGTEGGGVSILHTANDSMVYLLPGQGKNSLSSESVFAIYEDTEQRKWLGTLKGGINIIEPRRPYFQTISHNPLQPNSLIYNFISTFYEDAENNLWIGTDGGGLSIWNRKRNSFANFSHQPGNAASLSNNLVSNICQDYEGQFWIATFGGGINKFNKATNRFEHYACLNTATGEENKNAWLIFEDKDKTLWASTFARGKLYRLNRKANRFEVFDPVFTDLISVLQDGSGAMWAGNSHTLYKIDKQKRQHRSYEIGKPIRAISEDRNNNFWIGTEGGGLILFDRSGGKIQARYSDADGLCNNSVLNILEDGSGHLWLGTFNGLSRFTPSSKTFKNFNQSDGLQSNQFSFNAALRLRSGELAFGGINGFNLFHPDSLQVQHQMPPVVITGLRINNKPVTADDGYAIKTNPSAIEELKIPYDEGALSVDFAALEYASPDKINYACYLEGWDKDWNYTGNLRTASYTHLREGTYTLHIKATNANSEWNPKEAALKITVLPPWYRTWWAYLLYLLATASLFYLYLRYKTRQTRLEYEVKLAHLETEKEKELNEKKLAFFTDVSHEFRTPLTLIINPLKDVISGKEKTSVKSELNIVYRNARRLLSLVDQLLLFRKAGSEGDNLRIVPLNFYNLCHDVYTSFLHAAKSKKLNYHFHCENHQLELYADREKMEIILYNLLSNAIKFTPEGGEVIITIVEKEEAVEVKLADNGMGIPVAVGNKLFERFYRVPENEMPSKPGFGIGLFLVKHFVEKHKGIITYESQPGAGTTFSLKLLKGREHFGAVIIYEDAAATSPLPEAETDEHPALEKSSMNLDELVSSRQSILIVEDNVQVRQYIAGIFQATFTVYEAQSGDEGIRLAQEHLPDMVISDIMMQNGTGIELCSAIKTNPALSHIPVILLTGISSDEVKLKGIEHGADDYITKPFEKDLLVARVTNLLKKRSTLQNYFYNEITLQQNNLKVSEEYKAFLEKCIAIVEAHLDDEQFSIKTLAREIGMSHSNLYKRVKSISGQSINGFIRFIRLRKAAALFINTAQNVNETAFQVGMNDVKYFREQFNKLFGMNPSEYIKKYRKAFSNGYRINKEIFGGEAPEAN